MLIDGCETVHDERADLVPLDRLVQMLSQKVDLSADAGICLAEDPTELGQRMKVPWVHLTGEGSGGHARPAGSRASTV